jgi:hypothetical protein
VAGVALPPVPTAPARADRRACVAVTRAGGRPPPARVRECPHAVSAGAKIKFRRVRRTASGGHAVMRPRGRSATRSCGQPVVWPCRRAVMPPCGRWPCRRAVMPPCGRSAIPSCRRTGGKSRRFRFPWPPEWAPNSGASSGAPPLRRDGHAVGGGGAAGRPRARRRRCRPAPRRGGRGDAGGAAATELPAVRVVAMQTPQAFRAVRCSPAIGVRYRVGRLRVAWATGGVGCSPGSPAGGRRARRLAAVRRLR